MTATAHYTYGDRPGRGRLARWHRIPFYALSALVVALAVPAAHAQWVNRHAEAAAAASTGKPSFADAAVFTAAGTSCTAIRSNAGVGLSCTWAPPAADVTATKPPFADVDVFTLNGTSCVSVWTVQGVGLSCGWGKAPLPGVSAAKPGPADAEAFTAHGTPCIAIRSRQGIALSCAPAGSTR